MNVPGFPHWFTEGIITSCNADGERLAVGLNLKDGDMWLVRLSKYSNEWCSVRRTYPAEVVEYDRIFLSRFNIGGVDDRSGPGQLYLQP